MPCNGYGIVPSEPYKGKNMRSSPNNQCHPSLGRSMRVGCGSVCETGHEVFCQPVRQIRHISRAGQGSFLLPLLVRARAVHVRKDTGDALRVQTSALHFLPQIVHNTRHGKGTRRRRRSSWGRSRRKGGAGFLKSPRGLSLSARCPDLQGRSRRASRFWRSNHAGRSTSGYVSTAAPFAAFPFPGLSLAILPEHQDPHRRCHSRL